MEATKQLSDKNILITRICLFCKEEYFSEKDSKFIFCSDYCYIRSMDSIEVKQHK